MNTTVYQIVTDRIIDSLSKGMVPWRRPWRTEAPKNLVSGKDYRGINVLLLQATSFDSAYWLTFNQARSLGGSVKKGSRGTPVVFWKITEDEDANGKVEKSFLLRYYTVFSVEQCDGIRVPPAPPRLVFNPIAQCERIVDGYQNKPHIVQGGGRACYLPAEDRIDIPSPETFSSVEEFYSTLFHELAHSTGAYDRLARKGVTDPIAFGSHGYSFEELVAECASAFLCAEAGISNATLQNAASYIGSWIKRLQSEPRWLVQAAAQASKAADLVLGRVGEQAVEASEAA